MAYQLDTPEISVLTAAADYSSNQFQAVNVTSGAATVTLATVQGQKVIGFLQNDPTSGTAANVQVWGVAKCKAGAATTLGADAIVDSTGRVIDASNNSGYIVGTMLEAASGANEIISVLLTHRGDRPVQIFPYLVNLATVADGDIFTGYTPGFRGRVIAVDAVVTQEVTTGSKLSTLNVEIGTTNITGGAVALTSANTATHGVLVAGSAVTAANTFTATDTISFEASSTTAFSEGSVMLLVKLMQD